MFSLSRLSFAALASAALGLTVLLAFGVKPTSGPAGYLLVLAGSLVTFGMLRIYASTRSAIREQDSLVNWAMAIIVLETGLMLAALPLIQALMGDSSLPVWTNVVAAAVAMFFGVVFTVTYGGILPTVGYASFVLVMLATISAALTLPVPVAPTWLPVALYLGAALTVGYSALVKGVPRPPLAVVYQPPS